MRTKALAVAVVLAVTALGGVAVAGERAGFTFSGHGRYVIEGFSFTVSSNSAFGEVRGFTRDTGVFPFSGPATCLNSAGGLATTGWAITDGPYKGQGFEFAVQPGTPTSSPPGEILWWTFLPSAPTACAAPTAPPTGAVSGGSISDGRIVGGGHS